MGIVRISETSGFRYDWTDKQGIFLEGVSEQALGSNLVSHIDDDKSMSSF